MTRIQSTQHPSGTPHSSGWGGMRVLLETPAMHFSAPVQEFVRCELAKFGKQWIHEIVAESREAEHVRLRTADCVLLPDTNRPTRRKGCDSPIRAVCAEGVGSRRCKSRAFAQRFNWLAIVTDPGLRTLRDLRGTHLPMLERLLSACLETIRTELSVEPADVMVYVNYAPSVFRLHVHFSAPFRQHTVTAFDSLRVHSLYTIMNNLRLDPDYYARSTIPVPVHGGSDLCAALLQAARGEETPSPRSTDY